MAFEDILTLVAGPDEPSRRAQRLIRLFRWLRQRATENSVDGRLELRHIRAFPRRLAREVLVRRVLIAPLQVLAATRAASLPDSSDRGREHPLALRVLHTGNEQDLDAEVLLGSRSLVAKERTYQ